MSALSPGQCSANPPPNCAKGANSSQKLSPSTYVEASIAESISVNVQDSRESNGIFVRPRVFTQEKCFSVRVNLCRLGHDLCWGGASVGVGAIDVHMS